MIVLSSCTELTEYSVYEPLEQAKVSSQINECDTVNGNTVVIPGLGDHLLYVVTPVSGKLHIQKYQANPAEGMVVYIGCITLLCVGLIAIILSS